PRAASGAMWTTRRGRVVGSRPNTSLSIPPPRAPGADPRRERCLRACRGVIHHTPAGSPKFALDPALIPNFRQELDDRFGKAVRVVALAGVAGAVDADISPVRDRPRQRFAVFASEDVALSAVDDQGRARDAPHLFPEAGLVEAPLLVPAILPVEER